MAPFYGWCSTASRFEPLRGGSLLFTTKSTEIPGIYLLLRSAQQKKNLNENPQFRAFRFRIKKCFKCATHFQWKTAYGYFLTVKISLKTKSPVSLKYRFLILASKKDGENICFKVLYVNLSQKTLVLRKPYQKDFSKEKQTKYVKQTCTTNSCSGEFFIIQ